ncbi:MAG: hypothetical protein WBB76_11895 [Gaiellaceae bacterium]
MKLALVQPTLRREWHLLRGDDLVARLWLPLFRRGAAADIAGRELTIQREGGLRPAYVGGRTRRVLLDLLLTSAHLGGARRAEAGREPRFRSQLALTLQTLKTGAVV